MKKKQQTPAPPPKPVFCSDCRFAVRDTEGRSFSRDTGEYFMGKCLKGHNAPFKVFMNKPRHCADHRRQ